MSLSLYNQNNRHLFVNHQRTIHNENNNIVNKIKHRLFHVIIDDIIDSAQQLNFIVNKIDNPYSMCKYSTKKTKECRINK